MDIIALNITNLTDARYYAARNATWIIYNVSNTDDIPKIKQLQAWIDAENQGERLLKEFSKEEIEFLKSNLNIQGIVYGTKGDSDLTLEVLASGEQIIIHQTDQLSKLDSSYLWKKNWSTEDINQLNDFEIKGIIIPGTPEEEVGMKSYDLEDELLDKVDEINASL